MRLHISWKIRSRISEKIKPLLTCLPRKRKKWKLWCLLLLTKWLHGRTKPTLRSSISRTYARHHGLNCKKTFRRYPLTTSALPILKSSIPRASGEADLSRLLTTGTLWLNGNNLPAKATRVISLLARACGWRQMRRETKADCRNRPSDILRLECCLSKWGEEPLPKQLRRSTSPSSSIRITTSTASTRRSCRRLKYNVKVRWCSVGEFCGPPWTDAGGVEGRGEIPVGMGRVWLPVWGGTQETTEDTETKEAV